MMDLGQNSSGRVKPNSGANKLASHFRHSNSRIFYLFATSLVLFVPTHSPSDSPSTIRKSESVNDGN